ncbi:MAG: UDP-N-acetylglucosamine--N-acetylmuramyl-(pentapeptide) pyrophosphoryl-undecaprenol N-acetylglucosamine transferase, partial [Cryomorphaceae bacterium]
AAQKLGIDPEMQTVLVMGGSQGAKRLNSLIVGASKAMPAVQFLQITGNGDFERVKAELGDRPHHKLLAFCDDMAAAYAVSDLAVMRSGASSLTELSYLGMASILVPYPTAADDHQTLNAEVFDKVGAGLLRKESDMDAGSLVADLTAVLGDAERLVDMAAAAEELSVKDAAERICKAVENQ